MNSGSTSTLSGHLRSNHKDEYIEMFWNQKIRDEAEAAKEDKVEEAEDKLETVGHRKRKMVLKARKNLCYPTQSTTQLRGYMELMIYLATDNKPFSMCDSIPFQRLLAYFDSRF
ncbi:uncharacterized protein LOC136074975 [Hydra vulgaris]|uniref:Uncharacterized protein LOC136074975 n=1 Tax=Hydra vulgaris TaxID=6087 RepID=A0ABM4B317_HYDVU